MRKYATHQIGELYAGGVIPICGAVAGERFGNGPYKSPLGGIGFDGFGGDNGIVGVVHGDC